MNKKVISHQKDTDNNTSTPQKATSVTMESPTHTQGLRESQQKTYIYIYIPYIYIYIQSAAARRARHRS